MAIDALEKLELVWRPDIGADLDILDLSGAVVMPDGWTQAAFDAKAAFVDEVISLNLKGTGHDDLAALVREFDLKIDQVARARNPLEANGVWLRAQLGGETGARQALIIDAKAGGQRVTSPAIWSSWLYRYQLALRRIPLWESTEPEDTLTATLSTSGGTLPFSLDVGADLIHSNRVQCLKVSPAGTGKFTELWVGAKGPRFGDASVFGPVWECADIDNYWSDAGVSWILTDTTRTGGGLELTCDFGTDATLVPRAYFSLADFQPEGDRPAQMGSYLVLLQAYVTSGEVRVRGAEGYAAADSAGTKYTSAFRAGDRVSVTNTGYQLIPLGEFSLPPAFPGSNLIGIDFSAVRLEAERVSGSGSLVVRRIILIPSSEGYLYVQCGNGVTYSTDLQQRLDIYIHPDGSAIGSVINIDLGFVDNVVQPESHDFGLPYGEETGTVLVFAASSDTDLVSQISVVVDSVRRYASLRGSL